MLTKQEQLLANQNIEQANLYEPVQLLSIAEQVSLDLFSNANDYQRVASTVEAPILDNTNQLYYVDGIDDESLFNVLTMYKKYNRTIDTSKEENVEFSEKNIDGKFTTITNTLGNQEETWIQNDFGNMPWYTIDTSIDTDEGLEAMNPQFKASKVYRKQKDVEKRIMTNLELAWKEYHHWLVEKSIATGERYFQVERNLKIQFNKIKKLEDIKKRFEDSLELYYFNKNIRPQLDNLLSRYVDRQQRQLKMNKEPELSREDAIIQLKPEFKKYLHLYKTNGTRY